MGHTHTHTRSLDFTAPWPCAWAAAPALERAALSLATVLASSGRVPPGVPVQGGSCCPWEDDGACMPQGWLPPAAGLGGQQEGCWLGPGGEVPHPNPGTSPMSCSGPRQQLPQGCRREHHPLPPATALGSACSSPWHQEPPPSQPSSGVTQAQGQGTPAASHYFIPQGSRARPSSQRWSGSSPLTPLILLRRQTPSLYARTRARSILQPGHHGAAPGHRSHPGACPSRSWGPAGKARRDQGCRACQSWSSKGCHHVLPRGLLVVGSSMNPPQTSMPGDCPSPSACTRSSLSPLFSVRLTAGRGRAWPWQCWQLAASVPTYWVPARTWWPWHTGEGSSGCGIHGHGVVSGYLLLWPGGLRMRGQGWPVGKEPGHGDKDTATGQGMGTDRDGTGTQRWERASGQGHRTEHRDTATEVGQGMGTGTPRWDRVQGRRQSMGTQTGQGWDLQDFLLPRDLLRSLLAQGRGLALWVTDFTSRSMISSEASSGELGTSSWAGEPWAGLACPVPARGQRGCWHQPCWASRACLECFHHPAPTPAGPAAAGRDVRGGGQQALHALMARFRLLLGAAGHHGGGRSGLSNARELLGLQREERWASGTRGASPGGGHWPSIPAPQWWAVPGSCCARGARPVSSAAAGHAPGRCGTPGRTPAAACRWASPSRPALHSPGTPGRAERSETCRDIGHCRPPRRPRGCRCVPRTLSHWPVEDAPVHHLQDDNALGAVLEEVRQLALQHWLGLVLGNHLQVVPGGPAPPLQMHQAVGQLVKVNLEERDPRPSQWSWAAMGPPPLSCSGAICLALPWRSGWWRQSLSRGQWFLGTSLPPSGRDGGAGTAGALCPSLLRPSPGSPAQSLCSETPMHSAGPLLQQTSSLHAQWAPTSTSQPQLPA